MVLKPTQFFKGGHRMKVHANARLSPIGRRLLIDRIEGGVVGLTEAAEAAGISERTARKWLSALAG